MVVQIVIQGKPLLNGCGLVQHRRLSQIERGDYSPRAQVVLSSADARDIPFTEIVKRLQAAGHDHELII